MNYSWPCELWGLFILFFLSGSSPASRNFLTHMLIKYSTEDSEGASYRSLELSLGASLWSLLLCPKNSSSHDFLDSQLCLLGSEWPLGPIWVSPPCAAVWKLSPGSQLEHSQGPFHFASPSLRHHCLHCLVFNVWKTTASYILSDFLNHLRLEHKSGPYYSSLAESVSPHKLFRSVWLNCKCL